MRQLEKNRSPMLNLTQSVETVPILFVLFNIRHKVHESYLHPLMVKFPFRAICLHALKDEPYVLDI